MTATTTEDLLVQTPEDSILFMCRRSDLRLTWKKRYPVRDAGGQPVGMTPGAYVAFRDGVFRCPKEGPFTLVDSLDGGTFDLEDVTELLEWLDRHRLRDDREDGFWRVDPTAPPVSQDEILALNDLVLKLDLDGLERFIAQEEAGWGREDLLATARTTLEKVTEVLEAATSGTPRG